MHRLVNDTPEGFITDHINGDKLDNRTINLRTCTYQENQRNKPAQKNNASGIKGVCWEKNGSRIKRWKAQIYINKKRKHLGYFLTKEEAQDAYQQSSKIIFKEFSHA